MLVADLERQIRRGLLTLLKVFRRNNITIRGFLKMYPERFASRSGYVTVKDRAEPAPTSSSSTPAPEVSLADQIRMADERAAARKAARKETAKERLRGLSVAHGSRAPTR